MSTNTAVLAVCFVLANLFVWLFRKPKHPRVFRFDYMYTSAGEIRAGGQYITAMDLTQAKHKAQQILNGVQATAGDHNLYEDDRHVATLSRIFD